MCVKLFFFLLLADVTFMEVSALTGDGVDDAFLKCARTIMTKVESGMFRIFYLKKIGESKCVNAKIGHTGLVDLGKLSSGVQSNYAKPVTLDTGAPKAESSSCSC